MSTKKTGKKLGLHKQTIANLDDGEMIAVRGGNLWTTWVETETQNSSCPDPSVGC
jgi:uncharacterized protein YacL